MLVVLQRVSRASLSVSGKEVASIKRGYLLLVGLLEGDTEEDLGKMAKKIAFLRVFQDDQGKTNLDLKAVDGEILSVSQFTLAADCKKGNRPSFVRAMESQKAKNYYEQFDNLLRGYGFAVSEGIFGADMEVELLNDGPFTVLLDSREL